MITLSSARTCLSQIDIQASELDRDADALRTALKQLGNRSLLALKVPLSLGGAGFSPSDFGLWQIAVARYSGALAFLQTQHQSAGSFLGHSSNHALQREYLPQMARGNKLVGVGISHLRRSGKPLVTAKATTEGYSISGIVPWITGGNIFRDFIVGATLPDGRELYAVLPLQNNRQATGGSIKLSQPMNLIAMSATNTVSAELDNWKVKCDLGSAEALRGQPGGLARRDRVVTIKPANSIHYNSRQNILNHGWFPLGCAYSALDIIKETAQRKQLDFVFKAHQSLQQEVDNARQKMLFAINSDCTSYDNKLQLRSQVINLASRCTQAAIITASGAANNLSHAAGRVYREALVFSVAGQTTDVMKASLKLLIDG